MIPVQISLKNKKVLIVGGGKVGLRKAKLFLNEGAKVYILSKTLDKQLSECDIVWIHKNYESTDILEYFLVYAATDSKDINHKIVEDCNMHNILCGSATYDYDSSFYSMGYVASDVGTVALSMNQCLPYHKPLINKMMKVLDDNEIRIQKLFELRPFVLECAKNKKRYFELLFECDMFIVDFIMNVFMGNKGFIFVYHESKHKDFIDISFNNSIVLTINELEYFKELFDILDIVIVPLVMSLGYIYNKITNILPGHLYTLPLMSQDKDIIDLIHMYQDDNKEMIYITHPCSNNYIKETLKKYKRLQDQVIDFDEDMVLCKEKNYKCVVLLISHGTHFFELTEMFDLKIKEGYNIEYICCLSDDNHFKNYILDKLK